VPRDGLVVAGDDLDCDTPCSASDASAAGVGRLGGSAKATKPAKAEIVLVGRRDAGRRADASGGDGEQRESLRAASPRRGQRCAPAGVIERHDAVAGGDAAAQAQISSGAP
jgi:hypothetical protein